MKARSVLVVLGLVACRPSGGERASLDGSADAGETRDSGSGTAAGSDAGTGTDAELTVEVHGGNCPPDRQLAPGCRSYTLVLRGDGTLRGGKRKSRVPAEETEATLRLAGEAFAAKPTCFPNPPDRGGQAILLRVGAVTQAARGGCGPRIDALRARLEELAAAD